MHDQEAVQGREAGKALKAIVLHPGAAPEVKLEVFERAELRDGVDGVGFGVVHGDMLEGGEEAKGPQIHHRGLWAQLVLNMAVLIADVEAGQVGEPRGEKGESRVWYKKCPQVEAGHLGLDLSRQARAGVRQLGVEGVEDRRGFKGKTLRWGRRGSPQRRRGEQLGGRGRRKGGLCQLGISLLPS